MDPYIGTIMLFGGNFPIQGWAFCNGQLLSIAQNTALFSILGTTYGGNGQTTFALPDFRGRSPIHHGQGPGLSPITLGQQGGTETVTLLTSNMPPHTHPVIASNDAGEVSSPSGAVLANSGALDREYRTSQTSLVQMAPTGVSGGGNPFSNRDPYLAVSFLIALQGIFPSRN
ncbi:MAG: phage tail protein [Chitinophagaceae bacterium]|nr:MAG: phage tail protein [Chitinophagaceae bacterium]